MPLLALKHHCLKYIKDNSELIAVFEQDSFNVALKHRHVVDVLGLDLPAALSDNLYFLNFGDFNYKIEALRKAPYSLDFRLMVFDAMCKDRITELYAMFLQSLNEERLFVSTALDSTIKIYEFLLTSKDRFSISLFFNDYESCKKLFLANKYIYLAPMSELFNWSEASQQATLKAAAKAFKSLLHSNNRRAKYMREIKRGKSELKKVYEFFSKQEQVFLKICEDLQISQN